MYLRFPLLFVFLVYSVLALDICPTRVPATPCVVNEDCDIAYECVECPGYEGKQCFHSIIFTNNNLDILNTFLIAIIIFAAAFAGIGGGGLNVPVLSSAFFFGFQLTDAKILSHCAILGNTFAQCIVNQKTANLRLIALIFPLFLLGHSFGVLLFPAQPPMLVYSALSLSLVISGVTALYHFIRPNKRTNYARQMEDYSPLKQEEHDKHKIVKILCYFESVPYVWVIFTVVFILTGNIVSEILHCHPLYWIFYSMALIAALIAFLHEVRCYRNASMGTIATLPLAWCPKTITFLAFAAFLVGTFAGLVGVGGGEFITPILLTFHVDKDAASAATAALVFLSTSADFLHYLLLGEVRHLSISAVMLVCIGAIFGLSGRIIARKFFSEGLGRRPIPVLVLAILLLCSAGLSIYMGTTQSKNFKFAYDELCK